MTRTTSAAMFHNGKLTTLDRNNPLASPVPLPTASSSLPAPQPDIYA